MKSKIGKKKNVEKSTNTKLLQSLEKQKKMRGKRLKKEAPSNSSQNVITYENMFESGICELPDGYFSKTIQFSDVNYQTAQREDQLNIFSDYSELLNGCDASTHLEITLMNRKLDMDEFQKEVFYEEQGDSFDSYRKEFNQMLHNSIMQGQNGIYKENYLTFSNQAKSFDQAKQFLNRTEQHLLDSLSEMGAESTVLNGLERLEIIHNFLKPDDLFHFKYEDLIYSGLTTKAAIAPSSFNFKKSKYQFEVGSGVGQVVYLKDYPAALRDQLIREIMDIPEELALSIHIDPIAPDKANDLVQTKKMYMESDKVTEQRKAMQSGYDPDIIPYELQNSIDQAIKLLEDITSRGQKLFNVTFLVYVRADNLDSLNDVIEQVMSTGRRHQCGFSKLDYIQAEGLNAVLPLGKNFCDVERTLTTTSVAVLTPFTAQDLNHKDGQYYGINQSTKNIIRINRKKLATPSGLILGSSGSGKGVAKKVEEITTLLNNPNDEIISIDPEDEDSIIGKAFGAQIIDISPNTDTFINLLDVTDETNIDEDPVKIKTDLLLTAFESQIGGIDGLSAGKRSIIDRVTRITYARYFENGREKMPTLAEDWFPILKEQPEQEAKSLATDLELYIEGSLSLFSKQSNVKLNSRYIIYNTKKLGTQLKTFGLIVVLDQVWNRVVKNRERGVTTWIYIDELQLMFNDEYCSNFFFELWSRVRKWGAIPTGITQNVETLLESVNGRRMINNTEFIIMLKQAKSDRDQLSEMFGLSYQQEKQIINPKKGAGLIKAGSSIVPFSNVIEENTEVYQLVTTDPEDRNQNKLDTGA